MSQFDVTKVLSKRITSLKPSGIRKYFDVAPDVISLGVGEPDFPTPAPACEAAIRSVESRYTKYTPNSGILPLRKEISNYLSRRFGLEYHPEDEVIVTVGGSEGIDDVIRATVEEGDEVILPEPSFVAYAAMTTLAGGKVVSIPTKAENQFRLTAQELREKITPRTKILVLPFPNNPTGAIMKREHLEEIAEVLRETNIIVLSDEVYAELTYAGHHVSIASLEGMRERTVIVNSFSKAYAMTGWRIGYCVAPRPIMEQILKVHQYALMCAPTVSQYAALEAMKKYDDDIDSMVEEYDNRRRMLVKGFREIGMECFEPEGAFYVFPSIQSTGLSSEEFCERLIQEQKVAVVPGNAFGECGEGYVRISYAYSMEHLTEALTRIGRFLQNHHAGAGM